MKKLQTLGKLGFGIATASFLSFGLAGSSLAITGLQDFTGGFENITSQGNEGWQFTVNQSIDINKLGIWDRDADGLNISHEVGIWDISGGSPLASTVIQAGAASQLEGGLTTGILGGFRYETITPVTLTPGNYVIGAFYGDNQDGFALFSNVVVSPEITFITQMENANNNFNFPNNPRINNDGAFGPNFQYELTSAAVPFEFSPTLGLFVVGGVWGVSLLSNSWRV